MELKLKHKSKSLPSVEVDSENNELEDGYDKDDKNGMMMILRNHQTISY